jgi:hypothetical protein
MPLRSAARLILCLSLFPSESYCQGETVSPCGTVSRPRLSSVARLLMDELRKRR